MYREVLELIGRERGTFILVVVVDCLGKKEREVGEVGRGDFNFFFFDLFKVGGLLSSWGKGWGFLKILFLRFWGLFCRLVGIILGVVLLRFNLIGLIIVKFCRERGGI